MRNVCGSEFQTDGDENWKAHVQKSVLTNGWSGSWIAGACTYLLHLLQTRELWGLRIRLSLGSIPGPRGQVPKMRSRQTLISMCPKCSRCFRFFGHICRADPSQDHSRALYASTTGLPKHWRRRPGRPQQSWLRTIENDYTAIQSGSGDSSTACAEHNSRADTRGNSYVTEKLRMMTMKRSARYVHLCMQYCAVVP